MHKKRTELWQEVPDKRKTCWRHHSQIPQVLYKIRSRQQIPIISKRQMVTKTFSSLPTRQLMIIISSLCLPMVAQHLKIWMAMDLIIMSTLMKIAMIKANSKILVIRINKTDYREFFLKWITFLIMKLICKELNRNQINIGELMKWYH